MIKRPTWIMVILLALISGLAYYMQAVPDNFIKQALTSGKTPTPVLDHGTLISASDTPVSSITIASPDGHSVVLKNETSGWALTIDGNAPVPADQSAAEQASSQAATLRLTAASIPVTTSDLTGFGLDSPQYTYSLVLASGNTATFKIGKTTITGNGYYVQKEDNTIVVVDRYTMDSLINLLKQPPLMFPLTVTPTASITATELPTGTVTPTPPAATPTATSTPGAS